MYTAAHAFLTSFEADDIIEVDRLLAQPGFLTQKDVEGDTVLATVVTEGNISAIRVLIDAKSDVNTSNHRNITPLTYAMMYNHIDAVQVLISANASLDTRDIDGETVLMHAMRYVGRENIVQTFISAGADLFITKSDGTTLLMVAAEQANTPMVELLLQHGASVNARNNRGCTALMFAVWVGSIPCVDLLLRAGADATAMDDQGHTVLMRTANAFLRVNDDVVSQLMRLIGEAAVVPTSCDISPSEEKMSE